MDMLNLTKKKMIRFEAMLPMDIHMQYLSALLKWFIDFNGMLNHLELIYHNIVLLNLQL